MNDPYPHAVQAVAPEVAVYSPAGQSDIHEKCDQIGLRAKPHNRDPPLQLGFPTSSVYLPAEQAVQLGAFLFEE